MNNNLGGIMTIPVSLLVCLIYYFQHVDALTKIRTIKITGLKVKTQCFPLDHEK